MTEQPAVEVEPLRSVVAVLLGALGRQELKGQSPYALARSVALKLAELEREHARTERMLRAHLTSEREVCDRSFILWLASGGGIDDVVAAAIRRDELKAGWARLAADDESEPGA